MFLLYDVIRGYTFEMTHTMQKSMKFYTSKADTQLALMQKKLDPLLKEDAEQFGLDSDKLRAKIEEYVIESINQLNNKTNDTTKDN